MPNVQQKKKTDKNADDMTVQRRQRVMGGLIKPTVEGNAIVIVSNKTGDGCLVDCRVIGSAQIYRNAVCKSGRLLVGTEVRFEAKPNLPVMVTSSGGGVGGTEFSGSLYQMSWNGIILGS